VSEDVLLSALAGGRAGIARALSSIEARTEEGRRLLDAAAARAGRAFRIGVTGAPGVGKSTLIPVLVREFRAAGRKVAALCVDVSSRVTGGALLGDRIRMGEVALDEGVFIRSIATSGSLGGIAEAVPGMADLLDAAGFDVILIETAGVGQTETDIADLSDLTLVLVGPAGGDVVQAMKAGVMEHGDLFVVTKADLAGAERAADDVRDAIAMRLDATRRDVKVLLMSSVTGSGVGDLMKAIEAERVGPRSALPERRLRGAGLRCRNRALARLRTWSESPEGLLLLSRLRDGDITLDRAAIEALRGAAGGSKEVSE
jgi:LAO/AO transport system kinase